MSEFDSRLIKGDAYVERALRVCTDLLSKNLSDDQLCDLLEQIYNLENVINIQRRRQHKQYYRLFRIFMQTSRRAGFSGVFLIN